MREVVITRGQDAGTHRVYDREEALSEGIVPVPDWRGAVQGDWLFTDDGYVIQCIGDGDLLENKRDVRWVRTAIGCYRNRTSDSLTTEPRKNRFSFCASEVRVGKSQKVPIAKREKLFVELWFSLGDSEMAYRLAFENRTSDDRYVRRAVAQLLGRRRVIAYMREHLGDVLQKHDIDQDFVIENIKEIAETPYDPEKGHNVLPSKLRANVLLGTLVDIFDTLTGGRRLAVPPAGGSAEITDVEYEQIDGDVGKPDGKSLSDGETKALPSGDSS